MSRIDERLEAMKVDTSNMSNEEKFTAATGLTHYDEALAANDWYVPGGAANVIEEKDDQGEQGPQGNQGPQGEQGEQGTQGEQGAQGEQTPDPVTPTPDPEPTDDPVTPTPDAEPTDDPTDEPTDNPVTPTDNTEPTDNTDDNGGESNPSEIEVQTEP
jgi:hypothetical protein